MRLKMLEESLELSVSLTRADRLPKIIRTALQRLSALPCSELRALKPKERVTLSFLVRCTSYSSQATPIRVRKNVLANQIGVSERTLYRILNTLSKLGLITRHEQQIDRRAGAQVSEITWAPWFSKVLFEGLVSERDDASVVPAPGPDAIKSTLPVSGVSAAQSNAKLADACRYSQLKIRQSLKDSDQRRVPDDCKSLLAWMSESAIFKLMGAFSTHKKRLGDFVSSHYEFINKATNRFSYLYAIATNPNAGQSHLQRNECNSRANSSEPDHNRPMARPLPIVGASVTSGASTFVCSAKGLIEVYIAGIRKGSVSWDKASKSLDSKVVSALCAPV